MTWLGHDCVKKASVCLKPCHCASSKKELNLENVVKLLNLILLNVAEQQGREDSDQPPLVQQEVFSPQASSQRV